MPLAELIQRLIHKLEVGAGSRYLRIVVLALGVVALGFLYDLHAYRNLAAPEAMDAAQLARNISEGKGYTTLFIRPFSLYLVQNHNEAKTPGSADQRQSRLCADQDGASGSGESAGVSARAGGVDEGVAV